MGRPELSELREKLLQDIDASSGDIVELCSALIRIPSVSGSEHVVEIARFIEGWLGDRGIASEVHEPEPDRINLVARLQGNGKGRTLILNGHMDVVPPGEEARWQFPPFCGDVKDGSLLGRGATDMKGGLAAQLFAFASVAKRAGSLPGGLVFTAVPDEELGSTHGAKWLAESGTVTGDACLFGEPSGLRAAMVGEKGTCILRLTAKGVPAHGSMPLLGTNAIELMFRALPQALDLQLHRVEIPAELDETIRRSKEYMRHMAEDWGVSDPEVISGLAGVLDHSTVNISIVQGGTAVNVVPESCTAMLDIRVPSGTTSDAVRDEVQALLDGAGFGETITCEMLGGMNPSYTLPEEAVFRTLADNAKAILGHDLVPLFITGATDARFFRRRGIPAVHYGPGHGAGAHGYNESLPVDDLIAATKVIAAASLDFMAS